MKFLAVCHYSSAAFARLGPEDFKEIGEICAPHDKKLRESGLLNLVGSLGMPEESRTLRVEQGEVRVDEGPYAHTPEPFGAFFIIEADDMDQAVEIARLHPGVHLGDRFGKGGIEVRPITGFDQM